MCCQKHKGMRVRAVVITLAIGIFMTPYISGWQQRRISRSNDRICKETSAARNNSRGQLLWVAAMHALNPLPVRGSRLH